MRQPRFEEDSRLSLRELRILLALWRYRSNETGLSHPKQATLVSQLKIDRKDLQQALKNLIALGWLTVERRRIGRSWINHYLIQETPLNLNPIERPKKAPKPEAVSGGVKHRPVQGGETPPSYNTSYYGTKIIELIKRENSVKTQPSRVQYPEAFRSLWDRWRQGANRRAGDKQQAYRAYQKLLAEGWSDREIRVAIDHYMAECLHDEVSTKDMERFLRTGLIDQYQDEPVLKDRKPQSPQKDLPKNAIDYADFARRRQG